MRLAGRGQRTGRTLTDERTVDQDQLQGYLHCKSLKKSRHRHRLHGRYCDTRLHAKLHFLPSLSLCPLPLRQLSSMRIIILYRP